MQITNKTLTADLQAQLESITNSCQLPTSSLGKTIETKKASNLMSKFLGEENKPEITAFWAHLAWNRSIAV